MPTLATEKSVKSYREQSKQIEEQLKDWEYEIRLKDFNTQSEKCYKTFAELQISVASLTGEHEKENLQKECFKITEGLISFFDCHVKTDDLNYIYAHETTKGFTHLWDYLHKYCNDMVAKNDWARKY